ncbi:DUF4389 domain-containing protein [Kocuria sp. M1N1S27]|uniref:DUF4389 domain-containing protein n=1 Tax=Kocuria kalidii TaxID=3376283 RepID=UPI0037BB6DC1
MTAAPVPRNAPPSRSGPPRMRAGHWVLLVLGVLLSLLGLGLTIGGAVLAGADAAQRDGRYLTGETERYQSTGYALTSPSVVIDPGGAGMPGVPGVEELAGVQVRVTPVVPGQEIFVGIADASDVSSYLQDVPQTSLGNASWSSPGGRGLSWTDDDELRRQPTGNRTPADPGAQDFWVTSASGTGTQEITFDLQPGQWSLVVVNADTTRPVWVDLQAGARTELLGPFGSGLLIAGLVGLVVGLPLLLLGTRGLGRDIDPAAREDRPRTGSGPGAALAEHPGRSGGSGPGCPVRVSGFLDQRLSRGLWLVKWLLAIPHYIVLAILWVALVVTTIAAGITVLFTGRYPRSWFAFSVGVLRWSWRVGFYAYSVLGTDRYPPFTLAAADYPAAFDVAYPARLSRGLVLVKWWLLAIPHLLVVGVFTSGTGTWGTEWDESGRATTTSWGPSLLGLLVLIAAVILLFTGRYRYGLFALVVGLNRWIYRVSAYVLLLRDEYPPFRLDQGPVDPHPAPDDRERAPGPQIGAPAPGNRPPWGG